MKKVVVDTAAQLKQLCDNMPGEPVRISGFWATHTDVQAESKLQQDVHKRVVLSHLARKAEEQSLSGSIFFRRGLTRTLARIILRHLADRGSD